MTDHYHLMSLHPLHIMLQASQKDNAYLKSADLPQIHVVSNEDASGMQRHSSAVDASQLPHGFLALICQNNTFQF